MRTAPDPTTQLTPAGERIIAVASDLFYARGIRAVGVDLIADEAGTTKKTLYDRFGSKDGLVVFYLERRYLRWRDFVLDHLDRVAPTSGPDRVLAVFDALEEWMRDNDRGCGFVNAFAEIGGTDHPGLGVIRKEKNWGRDLMVRLAHEADLHDADTLGRRLSLVHEGAIISSTAGGFADGMAVAKNLAADLIRAAA
ncbi:TetR family transcriptional regulator [Rhodococcoides trifolii]|uniref:TetR family transcriptional regulator n=1 Tax=Rhodococcoides trifolii TaxID=908250 RepID=A0A917G0P7_9NOCA|nr:TetR/AcrR family transcriptional regulator [Rhodococcus trifolii]GGG16857.1 TetR family transcriptional regulator [Rhodococcus trifolii]